MYFEENFPVFMSSRRTCGSVKYNDKGIKLFVTECGLVYDSNLRIDINFCLKRYVNPLAFTTGIGNWKVGIIT